MDMLARQGLGQGQQGQQKPARYTVRIARNQDEIREAQRLRFRVFAEDLGARLNSAHGIDALSCLPCGPRWPTGGARSRPAVTILSCGGNRLAHRYRT